MRIAIFIFLCFLSTAAFAQKADSVSLKKAVEALNTALLQKDTIALNKLLDRRLNYGHSNGWIETQRDVIDDLVSGKLAYVKIEPAIPTIIMEGNTAAVRTTAEVDVTLNGKLIQLRLAVLQVWVWTEKRWQLFARQSVKLN